MEEEIKDVEVEDENDSKETEPKTNADEKKFSQTDLNKLMAQAERKWKKKLEDATNEFNSFKSEIELKEQAEETQLQSEFTELSKGYPEAILEALDGKTTKEKLTWMKKNPVNKTDLPNTPKPKGDGKVIQKIGTIF